MLTVVQVQANTAGLFMVECIIIAIIVVDIVILIIDIVVIPWYHLKAIISMQHWLNNKLFSQL